MERTGNSSLLFASFEGFEAGLPVQGAQEIMPAAPDSKEDEARKAEEGRCLDRGLTFSEIAMLNSAQLRKRRPVTQGRKKAKFVPGFGSGRGFRDMELWLRSCGWVEVDGSRLRKRRPEPPDPWN